MRKKVEVVKRELLAQECPICNEETELRITTFSNKTIRMRHMGRPKKIINNNKKGETLIHDYKGPYFEK